LRFIFGFPGHLRSRVGNFRVFANTGTTMAFFNRQSDKGLKIQTVQGSDLAKSLPQPSRQQDSIQRLPATRFASTEETACLSRGSKVNGKLTFPRSARIDCEVHGEVIVKDRLYIGQLAMVQAQIKATSIIVAGKVCGDVTCSQMIEIRPSGMVFGKLSAPVLVIQQGARFEGECSMPEGEDRKAIMPPRERVASFPLYRSENERFSSFQRQKGRAT